MHTVTWAPGSNPELDQLFDQLRDRQYQDTSHRLYKNYSQENFNFSVALTIHFDSNGNPELCSSIASRECWPAGAYRILNRLWKPNNRIAFPRRMSRSFGNTTASQLEWLRTNVPDYKLSFISRQSNNWQQFVIKEMQEQDNIVWHADLYKYLTCPNECDDTCWQHILYQGDEKILLDWKRRC
jgi:hypothetical protein